MMVELGREKRQSIRALCEGNREVLVRGAAEGTMGRVWTPGLEDASYCLVGSGDFAFLLGLPPKGPRALDLKSQLYQSAAHAFIYPENEMWEQWLLQEFDGQLRRVTRYALKKDEHHFDQDRLKANVKAVPQGKLYADLFDLFMLYDIIKCLQHDKNRTALIRLMSGAASGREKGKFGILI